MIIAIDGPAGSGKTTVARRLAKRIGVLYLNTGATYRALTLKALQEHIGLQDEESLVNLADNLDIKLTGEKVFLDGRDVSKEICSPLIDKNISIPVALVQVREKMVQLQRNLIKDYDAVVEGRDITTVVFPCAEYKFYLDASFKERARRRFKELTERGVDISLKEVERQMRRRDSSDLTRKISPLKKADDAIYLDTAGLTIEEALDVVEGYIKNDRYKKNT